MRRMTVERNADDKKTQNGSAVGYHAPRTPIGTLFLVISINRLLLPLKMRVTEFSENGKKGRALRSPQLPFPIHSATFLKGKAKEGGFATSRKGKF